MKKRRLGEWKKEHAAALRGMGSADTGARERLGHALDAMLGGNGQCVMTERPPNHIPLSARVSADGTVVTRCRCTGCDAARKCKCPACLAARRFARSSEAERPRSNSTEAERIADATFDLLGDQLKQPRPPWKKLAAWLHVARTARLVELTGIRGRVRVDGRIVSLETIRRWRDVLGDHAVPDENRLRMIRRQRAK